MVALCGYLLALRRKAIKRKVSQKAKDEQELRRGFLAAHPYCQGHASGAPGKCQPWTGLSVHEVWPRGRGGPTGDPRNLRVLCFELNRLISQDADVMKWAHENGWLVRASNGQSWLEQQTHDCGKICPFKEVS